MFDFVEDEDCKKLYVFFDSKGDLMASQKAPPNYKKNTKVRRGRHASSFVGLVAAVCAPPPHRARAEQEDSTRRPCFSLRHKSASLS